jgi:hypothetical protein
MLAGFVLFATARHVTILQLFPLWLRALQLRQAQQQKHPHHPLLLLVGVGDGGDILAYTMNVLGLAESTIKNVTGVTDSKSESSHGGLIGRDC